MTLQILGGFIAAVGIAAVALAFTVNKLFDNSGSSIPVDGVLTFFVGLGIFAFGRRRSDVLSHREAAKAAPVDEPRPVPNDETAPAPAV